MAERLRSSPPPSERWGRRWAGVLVAVAVAGVHGCVGVNVLDRMARWARDQDAPARMEVTYVREMAPATPPAVAPAPAGEPARPRPHRAAVPKTPASAPPSARTVASSAPASAALPASEPPGSTVAEPAELAASDSQGNADAAGPALPPPAASAPVIAQAASGTGAPFEWPVSTRMRYQLTGYYRGPVTGSAQVEWIRAGVHYQVHLDLVIGPSLTPIVTRSLSSDGQITPQGLVPQRYDQDTKVLLYERNRLTIGFEPGTVILANGERRGGPPGVQDTASQFVQLSYLFGTRPERLRVGQSVEIALALPRRVGRWTYDVVDEEVLYTAFGPLPSVHVQPRADSVQPGELSAQIWFAPQLRYLPVRLRIQQDPQTYVDLVIDKLPELAAEPVDAGTR